MKLKGNIWRGNGFEQGELVLHNGVIDGNGICVSKNDGSSVFDFHNYMILPGLVDVHVHLREPGFFMKETIATGTAAAAHGGYTAVCSMPNLTPPPDTVEHLAAQLAKIKTDARVRVYPLGTITQGQCGSGELSDMEALAPFVVGFSDDGRGVQSAEVMERAMRKAASLDKIIVAHCEDNDLLHGGYIHDGAYAKAHGHKGICSASEWKQVERDLLLAEKTGCRYHVCHVSTKESVALIRAAKARGVRVTCESTPHYLLLCEDDLEEDGRFKMNPPLRTSEDRAALLCGVQDGTIEIIATDHAPHSSEEKTKGLEKSNMGVVGLETSFAAMNTYMVKTKKIDYSQLAQLMSVNPRRIFGLPCGIE
ncbi:MAG: dihydroorotase, partial [Pygmaiobacter sp.]